MEIAKKQFLCGIPRGTILSSFLSTCLVWWTVLIYFPWLFPGERGVGAAHLQQSTFILHDHESAGWIRLHRKYNPLPVMLKQCPLYFDKMLAWKFGWAKLRHHLVRRTSFRHVWRSSRFFKFPKILMCWPVMLTGVSGSCRYCQRSTASGTLQCPGFDVKYDFEPLSLW